MKLRSLIIASALCLGSTAFLNAKTRTFTIDKPVLIGRYNVPAGTYRMTMRGTTAEITDMNHFADKKPVSVTATKTNGGDKFGQTVVKIVNDGSNDRVTEIDFSHSREMVQFQ